MSNCNNAPLLVNCNQGFGCLDIYNTSCIQYDGSNLTCLGINTGSTINDLLCSINNNLCTLIQDSGLVIVTASDPTPDVLLNKLVAGANIVLTGVGSPGSQQIRIDAVLGGQIIDELVRVSPTDTTSGFLTSKLSAGPCIYFQKVNPGLNEQLQVLIDWQCVLNQLSQLPGFCSVINGCIPVTTPMTCPYILLNSPSISGTTATATWVSSGTNFSVYVDSVIQPNMPTSSLTYTTGALTNGSHTISVIANCSSGTPNSSTQTFQINTTCPVPNSLTATITGGTAGLAWSLDNNSNNGSVSVQYKLNSVSNWTTATSVTPITTNYSITGLNSNSIYNFQVTNNCPIGGPSVSTVVSAIQLTCPTVTLTSTSAVINFSFPNLGGDVNSYTVTLFDSTGVNVIQTKVKNSPFSNVISDSFSGLTANTAYQVGVTVNAGSFSKTCTAQTISTNSVPSCPSAANFSVTLS